MNQMSKERDMAIERAAFLEKQFDQITAVGGFIKNQISMDDPQD